MIHDLFIPCRVGNYYLHTKRVLSVEVTPVMVQGLLLEYSGSSITLKNTTTIFLKDGAQQTQINALKKIVTSVGKIDEVVTTLATSAIIFKELDLPFIGRDTLKMVIPFEVENVLPFALDEAVIDFLITREDKNTKISTVLIAAVRKVDVDAQFELFQKAEVSLSMLTIDVFALYRFYDTAIRDIILLPKVVDKPLSSLSESDNSVLGDQKTSLSFTEKMMAWRKKIYSLVLRKPQEEQSTHAQSVLHNFQPKRSEICIDIGFNSIKVLYLKDGMLSGVRIIPFGIADSLDRLSSELVTPYNDLVHDLLSGQLSDQLSDQSGDMDTHLIKEFQIVFDEIARTLLYFEKQDGSKYLKPYRMVMSGFYSEKPLFVQQAKNYFGSIVEMVDIQDALQKLKIKVATSDTIGSEQTKLLAANLWIHTDQDCNFLQEAARKSDSHVVHVQLLVMLVVSIICLGGMWLRSSQELQKWQSSYNSSKKQFSQVIEQRMGIDLKGEKTLKTIVEKVEETYKRDRLLWFSFMKQNESSVLEYLQDLSMAIDRVSIGLDLRQMHIDFEKVTMTGSVKSFEALDTFEEELQELKLLKVVDKPRELSWTILLQPKDDQKGAL